MKNRFIGLLVCICVFSGGDGVRAQPSAGPSVFNHMMAAGSKKLPDFLPDYYQAVLSVGRENFQLQQQFETNNVQTSIYSLPGKVMQLRLDYIPCEYPQPTVIFKRVLSNLDRVVSSHAGQVYKLTETTLDAGYTDEQSSRHRFFAYKMENGVQVWSFGASSKTKFDHDYFSHLSDQLLACVDRQRYADSLCEGNVAVGRWGEDICDYAGWLEEQGRPAEALEVYQNHLLRSAFDYDAHARVLSLAGKTPAAVNSASIILKNAESDELIRSALTFLGKPEPSLADIPLLEAGEKGLQLILIPLPPCSLRVVQEAAVVYENITGVPTQICTLRNRWVWGTPERIYRQLYIQEMLTQSGKEGIDFSGWTKPDYISALEKIAHSEGVFTQFYISSLMDEINEKPGQYRVNSYLERLCDLLSPSRSDDHRTMYIGVTEANLYSGKSRFVFSFGKESGTSRASVLSYYMMEGKTLGENPLRRRLVERLGKEMVPASLKQLNIPRSIDPDCPYSYANGVGRLDEKTLNLAEPVKSALKRLKTVNSL